jgi:hypothetical protein
MRLGQNQLTGGVPKELGQLKALQTLYLHQNQLTGGIPKELGQLEALQQLFLHQNQLDIPKGAPLHGSGVMAYQDAEATQQFLAFLRQ